MSMTLALECRLLTPLYNTRSADEPWRGEAVHCAELSAVLSTCSSYI